MDLVITKKIIYSHWYFLLQFHIKIFILASLLQRKLTDKNN